MVYPSLQITNLGIVLVMIEVAQAAIFLHDWVQLVPDHGAEFLDS